MKGKAQKIYCEMREKWRQKKEQDTRVAATGRITEISSDLMPDMGGELHPFYSYTVTMEDGSKRYLQDAFSNSGVIPVARGAEVGDYVTYDASGHQIDIIKSWMVAQNPLCTGIMDKDERLICENDIVKFPPDETEKTEEGALSDGAIERE